MIDTKNSVARLLELGFQKVGQWQLVGGKPSFRLTSYVRESNILYAFVSNGIVRYIGKSMQTLEQRMNGYKNPGPTQRTNIRNHAKIFDLLKAGEQIEILAFCPSEPLFFKGYRVNLAAGLEDTLIEELSPEWNVLAR